MKTYQIRIIQHILPLVVLCAMLAGLGMPVSAAGAEAETAQTAQYLLEAVPEPAVSSIGGEWTVIGIAKSGITVPEGYFEDYYSRLEQTLTENQGVLSSNKYTEYARVVLALCAIGKDPLDAAGYNLIEKLCDYDAVIRQGINGAAYALIALDQAKFQLPEDLERSYTKYLIENQHSSGGFGLSPDSPDPDVTAIVLQALAPRMRSAYEKAAVCAALRYLSAVQGPNGGFAAWDAESSESSSQVILALSAIGLDLNDRRFTKDGNTVLDHLRTFRTATGAFSHLAGNEENVMATEQALLALNAANQPSTIASSTLIDKMIYEFDF